MLFIFHLLSLFIPHAAAELTTTAGKGSKSTESMGAKAILVSVHLKNGLSLSLWVNRDLVMSGERLKSLPATLRDGSRIWIDGDQIVKIKIQKPGTKSPESPTSKRSDPPIPRQKNTEEVSEFNDSLRDKAILSFNGQVVSNRRGSVSQNAIITSWDQGIVNGGVLYANVFAPYPEAFTNVGYRHAWILGELDEGDSVFTDVGFYALPDNSVNGLSLLLGYGSRTENTVWSVSAGLLRFTPTYNDAYIEAFQEEHGTNVLLKATYQRRLGKRGQIVSESWFTFPTDANQNFVIPATGVEILCYRHRFGSEGWLRFDIGGFGLIFDDGYSDQIRIFENAILLPYAGLGFHY